VPTDQIAARMPFRFRTWWARKPTMLTASGTSTTVSCDRTGRPAGQTAALAGHKCDLGRSVARLCPRAPPSRRGGRRGGPATAGVQVRRHVPAGSAYGLRRLFALPAERLISKAAVAGSTAKSSPAVYSASSTPPLIAVISQTAPLLSDVPPRTLKASSRTHLVH
jgi:hypothetical protein